MRVSKQHAIHPYESRRLTGFLEREGSHDTTTFLKEMRKSVGPDQAISFKNKKSKNTHRPTMVAIPRKNKSKHQQSIAGSVVSSLQVVVAIVGGLFCGAFVANIQKSTSRILSSASQQQQQAGHQLPAMARDQQDNSGCHLPPKSRKMTIPTGAGTFFELAVWNDGDYMTEQLAKDGFWEIIEPSGMSDLAETTLPSPGPDSVFWDIGANVGYYSFLFAAAGYKVVAFEPENTNAALFRASLCLNPALAQNIQLVTKALTSKGPKKECKIVAQARAERMKRYLHLIPRLICDTQCKRIQNICQDVELTTMDEALSSYPPPSIVKMDVEGHELAVFKGGADKFLKDNPPKIIQYENRDSRTERDIELLLEENGYRVSAERGPDSNTVAVLKSYASIEGR